MSHGARSALATTERERKKMAYFVVVVVMFVIGVGVVLKSFLALFELKVSMKSKRADFGVQSGCDVNIRVFFFFSLNNYLLLF